MKIFKAVLLFIVIIYLLSLTIYSQSVNKNEVRPLNPAERLNSLYGTKQLNEFDITQLLKKNNALGSPFNNIDNPQLDSVVSLKHISSVVTDTLKYYYEYDTKGNVKTETLKDHWKKLSTYNSDGNALTQKWMAWKNGEWTNSSLSTNTYDSLGLRTNEFYQIWEDSLLIDETRATYTYNSFGKLELVIAEEWDGNEWKSYFRRSYSYDSNEVLASILFQNWGAGGWNGYTWEDSYTYDSLGNQIVLVSRTLINGEWQNTDRYLDYYDENNNKILSVVDVWRKDWFSYKKYIKEYNSDNKRTYTKEEKRETVTWHNTSQQFYTYNEKGELEKAESEIWMDSSWIPGNRSLLLYDAEGNWRDYFGIQANFYYHTTTEVENSPEEIKGYSLSQNYPNPFNPTTRIEFTVPKDGKRETSKVILIVYDMLGIEVRTLVNKMQNQGRYEVQFNARDLASGVYFYRLQVNDFVTSKKMMLIK